MFTKVVRGCPPEVIEKRKARIQEALDIKFTDPKKPVKYVVDKLDEQREVFFLKPGKEYFRKEPNLNDMSPNVGKDYENFKFADIWNLLCRLYNVISLDNYKKLSALIYRMAYLFDFNYVDKKLRFVPDEEVKSEIAEIQREIDEKNLKIDVISFLHFLDVLSWNEDVKYHIVDNRPDFTIAGKRKNGRINTLLSCISVPILFQKFVDEVLKCEGKKEKIDFSVIIEVAQKFAKTRGVQPLSNKELIALFSPYLTN